MLTVILLSIGVPVLAGVTYSARRNRFPKLIADVRGIALQTVIIIVVLLAIAGAVAGVLVTRGEQATTQLINQDIRTELTGDRFDTRDECENSGYRWWPDGPDEDASTTGDNNSCWTN